MPMIVRMLVLVVALGTAMAGCQGDKGADDKFMEVGPRPDVLPVMLNKDLPFRYPPSLYSKKIQANVTLRVYIDSQGQIVSESTNVAESSGHPPMDSAAVRGSTELRFVPAKTRGQAVAVSILFPVYFRHPDAPPPAGDTVLNRKAGTQPADTGQ